MLNGFFRRRDFYLAFLYDPLAVAYLDLGDIVMPLDLAFP